MSANEIYVSPDVLKQACFGKKTPRYKIFYNVLQLLFTSFLNPTDFVLNIHAGRGGGVEACVLADLAEGRTVRAVEDDPKLVRAVASYTRRRTNLRLRRGTIGDTNGDLPAHTTSHGKPSRSYTLDHLAGHDGKWYTAHNALGLVLISSTPTSDALAISAAFVRGGSGVIARDRPIIAVRLAPTDALDFGRLLVDETKVLYNAHPLYESNRSFYTVVFVPDSVKLPAIIKNIL